MSTSAPPAVPLVELTRGGKLECVHFGHAVVCDTQGRVIYQLGDANFCTFFRSSAKPFQAITVIESGAAERFGFTDSELALICASHGAQSLHIEGVRSILGKSGLPQEGLGCGPHVPLHEGAAFELAQSGANPERIHNNCSGKHAGMLAACRQLGLPLESYLRPDHPLQQRNAEVLASFAGCRPHELPVAVDGCGVPTFFTPLRLMATAFARLATAGTRPDGQEAAADRVVSAMCGNPVHVAHDGQFDTVSMQHLGKYVVVKRGAEGLFCVGLRGRGLGLVMKVLDGSARPVPPVALQILERFLPDADFTAIRQATLGPVKNTRGEDVGEMQVAFK